MVNFCHPVDCRQGNVLLESVDQTFSVHQEDKMRKINENGILNSDATVHTTVLLLNVCMYTKQKWTQWPFIMVTFTKKQNKQIEDWESRVENAG